MFSHALVTAAATAPTTRASVTGGIGLPVAGVLCAAAAFMLMWKRRQLRRTQAVLLLVTGLSLAGVAGHLRDRLTELATSASATTTSKVFGVGVSYAVALVIVLWFVLDMDLDGLVNRLRRKPATRSFGGGTNKHTTTVITPWLALLVVPALSALPYVGALPAAAVAALG